MNTKVTSNPYPKSLITLALGRGKSIISITIIELIVN